MTALLFWKGHGPLTQDCTGYGDFNTECPNGSYTSNVPCSFHDPGCYELPYRITDYYTVDASEVTEVKASLFIDGPAYFRFEVFQDFEGFWENAGPGTVYRQQSGAWEGGHAVLLIGWDNARQAWLLKNSHGATAGPEGDGTFWMAWPGHAHDLDFGMASASLKNYRRDFNNDGYDDLAIDDHLGAALAAGDFNNDNYLDLAIGVSTEAVGSVANAGAVNVLYGSAFGLGAEENQLWHQGTEAVHGQGDRFGAALSVGDFDGDVFMDLAIGVPSEAVGSMKRAGAVNILYGSRFGITADNAQLWHQDVDEVPGVTETQDRFGAALSGAGP